RRSVAEGSASLGRERHRQNAKGRSLLARKSGLLGAIGELPALGAAVATLGATAVTPAAATTAPATTTTTAAAIFARAGDVDVQGAAVNGRPVHGFDGALSVGARAIFHEPEPARLAAVTVDDHAGGLNVAMRGKRIPQVLIVRGVCQIAYV